MHSPKIDKNSQIFNSFCLNSDNQISKKDFISLFKQRGILENDSRLKENFKLLKDIDFIDYEIFDNFMNENNSLLIKIFQNELIIPNWKDFETEIKEIFDSTKENNKGKVADYIPQLAKVSAELFSVCITSVDGQQLNIGDYDFHHCVQSCSKPISYCIAVEENGEEIVHNHIGREPSGKNFNELCLNSDNLPHNPLINSGSIMAVSLIKNEMKQADRFDHIMNYWTKLAGNTKINFNNSVYLSEKDSADRNFCLGYMMQENNSFSDGKNKELGREWRINDLIRNLELYFQCCSIELTCQDASIIAASLANGGTCPVTNEKVFNSKNVKNVLSLMSSCGMYDYSGEWAYSIGFPAKSGVSGLILAIIPNVMGIAIFSPKLDVLGNSVRGIDFFKKFGEKFSFHAFDSILDNSKKQITLANKSNQEFDCFLLLNAADKGDILEISRLCSKGVNLNMSDYDGRTALHLAASSNKIKVVKYLMSKKVQTDLKDRWDNTPLDDAIRENHQEIITLLK